MPGSLVCGQGPPLCVVGHRVDALVAAYQVHLRPAMADELVERQAFADEAGWAELRVDSSTSLALRRSSHRHLIYFENDDVRGAHFVHGPGGWNFELIARATLLATRELNEALTLLDNIASAFGNIVDSRLRRVDLAADLSGFEIGGDDVERIFSRARVDAFMHDDKDVDAVGGEFCKPRLVEHRTRQLVVTGFTIAPGNTLLARIYDKRAELALPGREEKRLIEESIWRSNGWEGKAAVTRAEFQVRGVALDEFKARNLRKIRDNVDPLWQSCVRWTGLREPESATRRTRWKLDPRWKVLCELLFFHRAAPAPRSRGHRRGARAAQVFGSALSYAASRGTLRRIDEIFLPMTGELVNLREFVASHDELEIVKFIRTEIGQRATVAANDASAEVVNEVIARFGPSKACLFLVEQINARNARVSSIDDLPIPKGDDGRLRLESEKGPECTRPPRDEGGGLS